MTCIPDARRATTTAVVGPNGVTTGGITPLATLNSIGFRAPFTNDNNSNATATLRYKRTVDSIWKTAYPPIVDRRALIAIHGPATLDNSANVNQARGSIVGLTENTSYDIELTWVDADGVSGVNPITATISTAPRNPPTGGTSYFVNSATGADGNAGTSSGSAWATIAHALSNTVAGDTINLNGTFAAFTVTQSGTSVAYRKIQVEAGHTCTITGGANTIDIQADYWWFVGLTMGASTTGSLFNIGSHHHIYIDSNTAADFATSGTWNTGAVAMSGAHDIFVLSNSFTRTSTTIAVSGSPGTDGICIGGVNFNVVIDGNTLVGAMWDAIGNVTNSALDGMENADFSNNTLTDFWDDGIEMDGGGINLRVWGNTISTATVKGSKNTGDNGADGLSDAGVLVGPAYVFRNYVSADTNVAVKGGHDAVGYVFYFHNTFVAKASSGGVQALSQAGGPNFSQNHVFRNNIFQSNNQNVWSQEGNRSGNSYDYDVLWGNGAAIIIDTWDTTGGGVNANYSTFANFLAAGWQATNPQEAHGAYGNPNLDASYHITNTSNAYNAGATLANFNDADSAWPATHGAPDIGAYEVP